MWPHANLPRPCSRDHHRGLDGFISAAGFPWGHCRINAKTTTATALVVGCVVVYQVRFIATKTGRTDYALAGESIELSCLYMMKDEAEDVKQVVWSKDGKNVSINIFYAKS